MPKFTFTCEHEHPIKKDVNVSTITYESNREYLSDILEDFRDFLKGCGFHVDGNIEVVTDDDEIVLDFSAPTMEDQITAGGYFNNPITCSTEYSIDIIGGFDGR